MNVKLQATWNVAFSWLCSRCMMADNTMLTLESIKKEAQSCNMQWSEIANSAVTEWFATLAKAKGTRWSIYGQDTKSSDVYHRTNPKLPGGKNWRNRATPGRRVV